MFVIPNGLVRDPVTKRHLPPEGKEVPESNYWVRRLQSGCVRLALAPVAEPVVPVNQIPDYEVES